MEDEGQGKKEGRKEERKEKGKRGRGAEGGRKNYDPHPLVKILDPPLRTRKTYIPSPPVPAKIRFHPVPFHPRSYCS